MSAEPRDSLWRRYLRLRRHPVYDAVVAGLSIAPLVLLLHPFHDDGLNVALALALVIGLGLLVWTGRRAERP